MEKTNFYMMMLNYYYVQGKYPDREYVFSVESNEITMTTTTLDEIFQVMGEQLTQEEITETLQAGQWEYVADTVTINRCAYQQLVKDSQRLAELKQQEEGC